MSKTFTLLIILLTAVFSYGAVTASLDPDVVAAGDRFTLWLSNDGASAPRIAEFPEIAGIRWFPGSHSSRTEIVNAKIRSSVGYMGQVLKEGAYEIPSIKVTVGRKTETTKPLSLKAVASDQVRTTRRLQENQEESRQEVALKDAAFVEGRFLTGDRPVYIGEEIPLEVKLYVMDGLRLGGLSWPEFEFDKVSFHDYKGQYPKNPRFSGEPTRTHTIHNNARFQVYTFRTAIHPLAIGEVKGTVTVKMEVQIPDQQRRRSSGGGFFDDFEDFFSFSATRRVPHEVSFQFPAVSVKALPEVPSDSSFLGLIGSWKVEYEFPEVDFKAGDPFTLSLKITGSGSLNGLNAPKLDLPGFRVYPPEIEKNGQSATVKYVIIPLRPGKGTIAMNTASFNLADEKYETFDLKKQLEIKPAANLINNAPASQLVVDNASFQTDAGTQANAADKTRSNILYLKNDMSRTVTKPLFHNNLMWLVLLILIGPLIFIVNELYRRRRNHLNNAPELLRRKKALSRRGHVLRMLKKSQPENISQVIQAEVVLLVNDYLGLPPGTSATELAEKVVNEDLSLCLRNSGNAGFMPSHTSMDNNELKKRIIKAMKFIAIFICLLIPATGYSLSEAEEAAFNAYDNGDFSKAAEYFSSLNSKDRISPNALYNLGNALCQSGNLAEALACYEQAHLLSPRDTDIIENLNFVRRQLLQPEIGKINNPGDLMIYCRDLLRPDQWLLALAAIWSVFWLLATMRNRVGFNRKLLTLIIIATAMVISLTAMLTQLQGPYSGREAIIKHNATSLRSLPSDTSGKIERSLPAGSRVQIIEPRRDWVRIRMDNTEGWLKIEDMTIIK